MKLNTEDTSLMIALPRCPVMLLTPTPRVLEIFADKGLSLFDIAKHTIRSINQLESNNQLESISTKNYFLQTRGN